jgi:hypothetical protein
MSHQNRPCLLFAFLAGCGVGPGPQNYGSRIPDLGGASHATSDSPPAAPLPDASTGTGENLSPSCAAQGKNCGELNGVSCGSCSAPQTCGGGGVANVCGCAPRTCAAAGKSCGALSDGCGGMISCGCAAPESCDPSGTCGLLSCPAPDGAGVCMPWLFVNWDSDDCASGYNRKRSCDPRFDCRTTDHQGPCTSLNPAEPLQARCGIPSCDTITH